MGMANYLYIHFKGMLQNPNVTVHIAYSKLNSEPQEKLFQYNYH